MILRIRVVQQPTGLLNKSILSIRLAGNKGKKDAANDKVGLPVSASHPTQGLPDALWNLPPRRHCATTNA